MLHICLISEQLLANLIPVLLERPRHVVLIVSDKMNAKAAQFRDIMDRMGITVSEHTSAPDHGYWDIWEFAAGVKESLDTADALKVNITGGNKLMAMAFADVFADEPIIYLDTAHNRIEYLGKGERKDQPLPPLLDIETYLMAQGADYRSHVDDQALHPRAATQHLAKNARRLGGFFGMLNKLADDALYTVDRDEILKDRRQTYPGKITSRAWREALECLQNAGLLEWDGKSTITFQSADKTRYCRGLWLEEYVYQVARDLKPDDVRMGVKVTWRGTAKKNAPRNEFDVLIVHNNRLLLIECKTSRFGEAEKGQQIVNKLENLGTHAGGSFGFPMLVSARALDEQTRHRCQTNLITYLEDPVQLKDSISQWMAGTLSR